MKSDGRILFGLGIRGQERPDDPVAVSIESRGTQEPPSTQQHGLSEAIWPLDGSGTHLIVGTFANPLDAPRLDRAGRSADGTRTIEGHRELVHSRESHCDTGDSWNRAVTPTFFCIVAASLVMHGSHS